MQLGLGHSTKETAQYILSHSGLKGNTYSCTFSRIGFYQGIDSLILREIPFSAIQFPIYEFFKKRELKKNNGGYLTWAQNAQNGACSGGIAGFLTCPIDVAKTKLMTSRDGKYKNLIDALAKVTTEEGFMKLFSAAHIRVFNLSFGGIVFFSSYEFFKKNLLNNFFVSP
jgi:solute carrier family 25 S-adenosylmethionine transporter 26